MVFGGEVAVETGEWRVKREKKKYRNGKVVVFVQ